MEKQKDFLKINRQEFDCQLNSIINIYSNGNPKWPQELFSNFWNHKHNVFMMNLSKNSDVNAILLKLELSVKKCGGYLLFDSKNDIRHAIRMLFCGEVMMNKNNEDFFHCQYFLDCMKQRKLLNINHYRINKSYYSEDFDVMTILNGPNTWDNAIKTRSSDVSDFSDDEDSVENLHANKPTRINTCYSLEEDMLILNYIKKKNKFHAIKGVAMWKDMASHKDFSQNIRSWGSLKERFNKRIYPRLTNYGVSKKMQNRFIVQTKAGFHSSGESSDEDEPIIPKTAYRCRNEVLPSRVESMTKSDNLLKTLTPKKIASTTKHISPSKVSNESQLKRTDKNRSISDHSSLQSTDGASSSRNNQLSYEPQNVADLALTTCQEADKQISPLKITADCARSSLESLNDTEVVSIKDIVRAEVVASKMDADKEDVGNSKAADSKMDADEDDVGNSKAADSKMDADEDDVGNSKAADSKMDADEDDVGNSKAADSKIDADKEDVGSSKAADSKIDADKEDVGSSKAADSKLDSNKKDVGSSKAADSKMDADEDDVGNSKAADSKMDADKEDVGNSKAADSKMDADEDDVGNSKAADSKMDADEDDVGNSKAADSKMDADEDDVGNSKAADSKIDADKEDVGSSKAADSKIDADKEDVGSSKAADSKLDSNKKDVGSSKAADSETSDSFKEDLDMITEIISTADENENIPSWSFDEENSPSLLSNLDDAISSQNINSDGGSSQLCTSTTQMNSDTKKLCSNSANNLNSSQTASILTESPTKNEESIEYSDITIATKRSQSSSVRTYDSEDTNVDSSSDEESCLSDCYYAFYKSKGFKKSIIGKTERRRGVFSLAEDVWIINYIHKNSFYGCLRGRAMWMDMSNQKVKPKKLNRRRTWQSLRERYIERILPNIEVYRSYLPDESIIEESLKNQIPTEDEDKTDSCSRESDDTNKKRPAIYTYDEKKKIVDYIIHNNYFSRIKGNVIYQNMERRFKEPNKRTWQSLKNTFLKYILPNIKQFTEDEAALKKFKSNAPKTKRQLKRERYSSESDDDEEDDQPTTSKVEMKRRKRNLFNKNENLFEMTPALTRSTRQKPKIDVLNISDSDDHGTHSKRINNDTKLNSQDKSPINVTDGDSCSNGKRNLRNTNNHLLSDAKENQPSSGSSNYVDCEIGFEAPVDDSLSIRKSLPLVDKNGTVVLSRNEHVRYLRKKH